MSDFIVVTDTGGDKLLIRVDNIECVGKVGNSAVGVNLRGDQHLEVQEDFHYFVAALGVAIPSANSTPAIAKARRKRD